MYLYFEKFVIYFLIQLLSFLIYTVGFLPHIYYFNIFNFYSRINYLIYNPTLLIVVLLLLTGFILFIYVLSKTQVFLLSKIKPKSVLLISCLTLLIVIKLLFNNVIYDKVAITFINQNRIIDYYNDYKKYTQGLTTIENYKCASAKNTSPSKELFYNNKNDREMLLLIESWGALLDTNGQKACLQIINESFERYQTDLLKSYTIKFATTCFNGNTASAEGRELLNINSEESYRAFLENDIQPDYNLIEYKNNNNYYTISGFSASQQYGSNSSNAARFRKKLGFNTNIFYEELKQSYPSNNENTYTSVADEHMIDSLINLGALYNKVFIYGLTINTHAPFKLDMSQVDINDYTKNKETLNKYFNGEVGAFDQFYRIAKIIEHVFNEIAHAKKSFDKVLIIGDHPNSDIRYRGLYNQELVPYIVIQKK